MFLAKNFAKLLIRTYQLALSPMLGVNCRFTPSCSHYAAEAISSYGTVKGSLLTCKRLLCCQPFSKKSGYNPVPPLNSENKV